MPYRIEYTRPAINHLRQLTARLRAMVLDTVDHQLTYEPTRETRNRREMIPNDLASWELRIGDLRVYYDVLEESQTVMVAAVGIKRGNRVFIGGLERDL